MRVLHRAIATVCLVTSAVGVGPASAHAQKIQLAGVSRPSIGPRPDALVLADTAKRPSVWWYVGGGAALGAGIAGLGFALDDPGDAILYEITIAGVVPASAILGAGLGWLVYRLRY